MSNKLEDFKPEINGKYIVQCPMIGVFPNMLYIGMEKDRFQFIRRGGGDEIRLSILEGLDFLTRNGWHEDLIVDISFGQDNIRAVDRDYVGVSVFTIWTHDFKLDPNKYLKRLNDILNRGRVD